MIFLTAYNMPEISTIDIFYILDWLFRSQSAGYLIRGGKKLENFEGIFEIIRI